MKTCLVVLSGGQDSTTCLYYAKKRYDRVYAITFDYGQRHWREIHAAERVAEFAGIPPEDHEIVKLGSILKGTSPLVSDNELEQYDHHSVLPGGLEKTFVPMRNQLFLTIAANRAYTLGTNVLITGVSAEDFGGYPDCRPEFIEAFVRASSVGTFTGRDGAPESLVVRTPLMHATKKQTVEMAMELDGCYEALALTHTAYDGQYPPVGRDHATLLRAKGFEEAGIPDPLLLRAHLQGLLPGLPDTPNYRNAVISQYFPRVQSVIDWLNA